MKIALLGYGKMGQEINRLITDAGQHEVTSISFKQETEHIDEVGIKNADVVIDFTSPVIALDNISKVAGWGKPMVMGTTGWYEHLPEVEKIVTQNNTGLIYAQNFSIGANIFFQLVAETARLAAQFGRYDAYGFEIHHTGKKDSPSGTALRVAQEILQNFPAKKELQVEKLNRQINPEELHFASIRGGRNPGFHQVVFDSGADAITLSHAAHNRQGFAEGAILAAEFILGKKGFFSFDQIFKH